jgi:hypothetical protein
MPTSPQRSPAGDLGPWLGRGSGVLTPHVRALGAPVAAHGQQQRGGAPRERLVRQLPCHGVARDALAAAPPAPVVRLDHPELPCHGVARDALAAAPPAPAVRLDDPAGEHGAVGLEQLGGDLQTEAVQTGEGGQVGGA